MTRRSDMLRPAATLLSGSGAAFLIGYLAKPVILRLFPVAAFGVYDFIVALVAIAIPVASLRYEDAIVLPESEHEARDVLGLSTLLTLAVVGLGELCVFLFRDFAPPEVRPWLWTAPLLLLIIRISKLGELWLTRLKRFRPLAVSSVSQSAAGTATRVALGLRGAGPGGLLLGFGLGHFVAACINVMQAATRLPRKGPFRLRAVAQRYRRFPQLSAPAALVGALATKLPFVILLAVFGAEVLGWFGQAFNVLYVPLSLVGMAIGQVFFIRAAEAHRTGTLAVETLEAYRLLVSTAVVPLAAVCAAAPEVFSFVFGAEWETAGRYAWRIAPWVGFAAVASPLTRVFDVTERQGLDLAMNALSFALVGAALVAGSVLEDELTAIALLGVAGLLSRLIQIGAALSAAQVPARDQLQSLVRPIAEGVVVFGLVTLASSGLGHAATTGVVALLLTAWGTITLRRLSRRQ